MNTSFSTRHSRRPEFKSGRPLRYYRGACAAAGAPRVSPTNASTAPNT